MVEMLARQDVAPRDDPGGAIVIMRMKQENFQCTQKDHDMLVILARAIGETRSETLRRVMRKEFYRLLKSPTEEGEILRLWWKKHNNGR